MGRASASSGCVFPADSAAVNPSRSASSIRAALPAWLAIPVPSVVTMTVLRRLVGFTFKVLSFDECCVV
jgi:hypothetical protein